MRLEPQIKQLIGKLNLTWFIKLKDEFIKHPCYNENTKSIDETFQQPAFAYDPSTGEMTDDVYETLIQATLTEYGWRGEDYPMTLSEEDEDSLVLKAKSVTGEIIGILIPWLKKFTT